MPPDEDASSKPACFECAGGCLHDRDGLTPCLSHRHRAAARLRRASLAPVRPHMRRQPLVTSATIRARNSTAALLLARAGTVWEAWAPTVALAGMVSALWLLCAWLCNVCCGGGKRKARSRAAALVFVDDGTDRTTFAGAGDDTAGASDGLGEWCEHASLLDDGLDVRGAVNGIVGGYQTSVPVLASELSGLGARCV